MSTYAGSAGTGLLNSVGTFTVFSSPQGLGVDATGNIFVADQSNCVVRKIDINAIVTTFAGSTYGYSDGLATNAQMMYPYDIAVGMSGYYVPTIYDHRIRLISTAGYVSSFAGSGTFGDVDGVATSAKFNTPYGVAVASDGTVFVADYYNAKIRKISGGLVSTYGGNGYGSADGSLDTAQFTNPFKITVDLNNNIYVTEKSVNSIRMISSSGIVSTLFTSITTFCNPGTRPSGLDNANMRSK